MKVKKLSCNDYCSTYRKVPGLCVDLVLRIEENSINGILTLEEDYMAFTRRHNLDGRIHC
ncbi:MAG: hypothetical protein MI975_22605 [Cytophagales bacterium]|nr:hypothetical protein [Cytophagales bacterium]